MSVPIVYFVKYEVHNKDNNGWAYKIVNKYNSQPEAETAYYGELEQKIGGDPYDIGTVTLYDSLDNTIMSRHWDYTAPEPTPTEE